jgi:UbiD family decarboxylase
MVKCETCNLLVPATAEIILEGEVFPEEKKPDAPFGEYPGRQGGPKLVNVFHLKLITHRNNPIFHGTRTGWPSEGNVFWLKSLECAAYSKLKKITGVVDVHIPPPGVCFKLIISLRKSWRGQVNQIIQYVWGDPELAHVFKNVVVVDEHVDIHNPAHVEWAVATHVQPDRDIIIVPQCPELGLDPSQVYSKRGWTSKWGIDATIPTEAYEAEGTESPKLCDDPDIKARVEAQWEKYGINL